MADGGFYRHTAFSMAPLEIGRAPDKRSPKDAAELVDSARQDKQVDMIMKKLKIQSRKRALELFKEHGDWKAVRSAFRRAREDEDESE